MPPLVGVAVKVMLLPAHTLVADAAMLTLGATDVPTVIAILLDVAVLEVTQPALLVNTTLTTSLLLSVEVTKIALLVP